MDAFQAERFIPTEDENYVAIERIARQLGISNPEEEFDTDSIMGKDVLVDVKIREWTDRNDSSIVNSRPFISDIFLR